ncbi:AEC family transporter [uncultured Vagococcus sp.]|uniref:AEC family transporter n=1 Tax=uncultured Vagococcus sp. TaxID=189676 RepID=UPI0028D6908D|nr:AEC family transporter [uncultured Vagococcus sp.]
MLESYLNILVVFALVFMGYWLSFKKWFDNRTIDLFSKLVLNIALPFNMFLNMTERFTKAEFLHLFTGMLLPMVSILVTFCVSYLYAKITKVPQSRMGVFQTMFTASNTIFMGLPINLAIFGEVSVPYVLLYYICNTTFFWTVGIYLISGDSTDPTIDRVQMDVLGVMKLLLSPAMLGFIVGLLWMLLELPTIDLVTKFSRHLSHLTTPLSMFVIGIIVFQTGIRNLKINKDTFGILLGRYLISPIIVILLSFVIKVPEMMLKVFIIQSAMPAQNSMPILARQYKADVEFTTTTQALTFVVYLFIIPILIFLVN